MKKNVFYLFGILSFLLFACDKEDDLDPDPTDKTEQSDPDEVSITNLVVDPAEVGLGKSLLVTADVANADEVELTMALKSDLSIEVVSQTVAVSDGKISRELSPSADIATGLYLIILKTAEVEKSAEVNVVFEAADQIFINGTMNDWGGGEEIAMTKIGDYTWAANLILSADAEFKFVTQLDWSGLNYGKGEEDGKVSALGDNIIPGKEGAFRILFNEKERTYTLEEIELASIQKLIFDPSLAIKLHASSVNNAEWLIDDGSYVSLQGEYSVYAVGEIGHAFDDSDEEFVKKMWGFNVIKMVSDHGKWMLSFSLDKIERLHDMLTEDELACRVVLVHKDDVELFEAGEETALYSLPGSAIGDPYWPVIDAQVVGTYKARVSRENGAYDVLSYLILEAEADL
jgi:5-hydroxyisourate hydrolase-like protein (transthyretin family)